MLDPFPGVFSVAEACMLLPKHRRFTGCETGSSYVAEAISQPILLHTRQVLTKEPDIDGKEDVRSSADVYTRVVETIEVRKRLDVSEVLEGLRIMKSSCQTLFTT